MRELATTCWGQKRASTSHNDASVCVMSAYPHKRTFGSPNKCPLGANSGQTPLDEMRRLLIQIDPSALTLFFLNFC